jgi:uncharacterized protein YyaL (SSP411 family)
MQQLKEALDEDDAILVATVYGVTAEGNGEHANILNRLNSQQVLADDARLEKIRKKLLTVRNQRNRPGSCPTAWCRSGTLSSIGCVVRRPFLAS